mgnify:CR=1 FL=1
MTPDLASQTQPDALVREIERQCDAECRAILETAGLESRAIVADAFAAARRHVHEAFEDMRRDGERRLARAEAQIATELRVRDQARAAGNLRDGCPVLVNAVADRWSDREARRLWAASLADEARRRLRPGAWVVEHPADWGDDEQAAFLARLGPDAGRAEVTFRRADELDTGLRIRANGAVLDATPERLLADKPAVQALLLAAIGRLRSSAAPIEGGTP